MAGHDVLDTADSAVLQTRRRTFDNFCWQQPPCDAVAVAAAPSAVHVPGRACSRRRGARCGSSRARRTIISLAHRPAARLFLCVRRRAVCTIFFRLALRLFASRFAWISRHDGVDWLPLPRHAMLLRAVDVNTLSPHWRAAHVPARRRDLRQWHGSLRARNKRRPSLFYLRLYCAARRLVKPLCRHQPRNTRLYQDVDPRTRLCQHGCDAWADCRRSSATKALLRDWSAQCLFAHGVFYSCVQRRRRTIAASGAVKACG